MLRLVISTMALSAFAGSAFAQDAARPQVSQCQLIAEKIPNVQYANFTPPASGAPALTLAQVAGRRGHHLRRPFDLPDRYTGRHLDRHGFQRMAQNVAHA